MSVAASGSHHDEFQYVSTIEVKFPDADQAVIVMRSLRVDEDLRLERSRRLYSVTDQTLKIRTEATSIKFLRVSVDSMLELLILAVNTVGEFWPTRCLNKV